MCKAIQISYELKFEFQTRGFHLNSYINIPITIGTVPLDIEVEPFSVTEATAPAFDSTGESRESFGDVVTADFEYF